MIKPASTRAVFFDLFETLVAEGELTVPAGIPERVYRQVRRKSRDAAMTGQLSYEDILRKAGAYDSMAEELYARRIAEKAAFLTNVAPDVLDMLRQVRVRGILVSVISNCSADETVGWPDSPLSALVDDAVFSHQVGLVKPDPAIYLIACRRLGVSPHEAVFVGDGGSDELRGAADIGMSAYQAGWYVARPTEFASISEPHELEALINR